MTSESVEGLGGESPLKQDWYVVLKFVVFFHDYTCLQRTRSLPAS